MVCFNIWASKRFIPTSREIVQLVIDHYFQRGLIIRGRITVFNTLIFPKIRYCLRLLWVSKHMLQQLQRYCYRFSWRKKSPSTSFEQLCLPRAKDGVSIIRPAKKHLVLQMKCLSRLFSPGFFFVQNKFATTHVLDTGR